MTREQLDELARLQAAAMAEKTTIAICAYRRALMGEGDALLEYVRRLERERDEAEWAANPNADKARVWLSARDAYLRREGAAEALLEVANDRFGDGLFLPDRTHYTAAEVSEILTAEANRLREGE